MRVIIHLPSGLFSSLTFDLNTQSHSCPLLFSTVVSIQTCALSCNAISSYGHQDLRRISCSIHELYPIRTINLNSASTSVMPVNWKTSGSRVYNCLSDLIYLIRHSLQLRTMLNLGHIDMAYQCQIGYRYQTL